MRTGAARSLALALAAGLSLAPEARAAEPVRLRFDTAFVLERVADLLGATLRPDRAPPVVRLESATPLAEFRDAMAAQWGFVPPAFSNGYAIARNEIFLIDDPSHYARLGRTIDDALAHELAHYVQVRYFDADLHAPTWEQEAIAVQAWFAAHHVRDAHAALPR